MWTLMIYNHKLSSYCRPTGHLRLSQEDNRCYLFQHNWTELVFRKRIYWHSFLANYFIWLVLYYFATFFLPFTGGGSDFLDCFYQQTHDIREQKFSGENSVYKGKSAIFLKANDSNERKVFQLKSCLIQHYVTSFDGHMACKVNLLIHQAKRYSNLWKTR